MQQSVSKHTNVPRHSCWISWTLLLTFLLSWRMILHVNRVDHQLIIFIMLIVLIVLILLLMISILLIILEKLFMLIILFIYGVEVHHSASIFLSTCLWLAFMRHTKTSILGHIHTIIVVLLHKTTQLALNQFVILLGSVGIRKLVGIMDYHWNFEHWEIDTDLPDAA